MHVVCRVTPIVCIDIGAFAQGRGLAGLRGWPYSGFECGHAVAACLKFERIGVLHEY